MSSNRKNVDPNYPRDRAIPPYSATEMRLATQAESRPSPELSKVTLISAVGQNGLSAPLKYYNFVLRMQILFSLLVVSRVQTEQRPDRSCSTLEVDHKVGLISSLVDASC